MRALLIRTLTAAIFATTPLTAIASQATDHIRNLADQAISTLADTNGNLSERETKLSPILADGFDMAHIARFAMGRYWNKATEDQQRQYVAAFSQYVIATYARRFGGYSGEKLTILNERELGPKDYSVVTRIERADNPPIDAEWRVRIDDGPAKVIDVVVEGVSMSVTQRAEFASVVRQNGVDGLISVLQARSGRLKAQ